MWQLDSSSFRHTIHNVEFSQHYFCDFVYIIKIYIAFFYRECITQKKHFLHYVASRLLTGKKTSRVGQATLMTQTEQGHNKVMLNALI